MTEIEQETQGSIVLGTVDWQKGFPVASICRADLQAYFSDEAIAGLSDADMERIAGLMEDRYCDEGYWEDVLDCTERVLAELDTDKAGQEKSDHLPDGRHP